MELKELLDVANEEYPDGFLDHFYDDDGNLTFEKDHSGDVLAEFIVIELMETYAPGRSDREDLDRAIEAMDKAKEDIDKVIKSLKRRKYPLKWAVGKAVDDPPPRRTGSGDT